MTSPSSVKGIGNTWGSGLVRIAESEAGLEPLGALYHKSLEPLVLERLGVGHLGLQALLADLTQQFGAKRFANFNTVAELEALGGCIASTV